MRDAFIEYLSKKGKIGKSITPINEQRINFEN